MTRENIRTPDGGTIELFSTGAELASAGSGIVVVPASMVTAADYTRFAQKLSASLGRPVHTFNRRGRGSSSPQPEDYTLDVDIHDLDAVMKHTASTDVFGHSFGGAVALHAARTLPVERLAVYDPAVSVNHSVTADWTPEYERATAAGDDDRALAVLLRGLETGSALSRMPLSMLTLANKLSAGTPDRQAAARPHADRRPRDQGDHRRGHAGRTVPGTAAGDADHRGREEPGRTSVWPAPRSTRCSPAPATRSCRAWATTASTRPRTSSSPSSASSSPG